MCFSHNGIVIAGKGELGNDLLPWVKMIERITRFSGMHSSSNKTCSDPE